MAMNISTQSSGMSASMYSNASTADTHTGHNHSLQPQSYNQLVQHGHNADQQAGNLPAHPNTLATHSSNFSQHGIVLSGAAAAGSRLSFAQTHAQMCCECPINENRCSVDATPPCTCALARRVCDERCSSAHYRADCLNQAICKCSCEAAPAPGHQHHQHQNQQQNHSNQTAPPTCCGSNADNKSGGRLCDCARLKEPCSRLCACKRACANKEAPKKIERTPKPQKGCTCAESGKKSCVKKACPCRTLYEFCSPELCKCASNCSNTLASFSLPKQIQTCFLDPRHESTGLVVTLSGIDYTYRADFYHDSKNDPHVEEQLVTAMDFYGVRDCPQDCDPRCAVVDECSSNKACARLLGLLLAKTRKELANCNVKMTVKFLMAHLARGDLYTKQGILCMLQSGVKVEPLLMKDWSDIMDWCEKGGDHVTQWHHHNLDTPAAQAQAFINECRRALGLPAKFWLAEIHELVKTAVLHYSDVRAKMDELAEALEQLDLTATPRRGRGHQSAAQWSTKRRSLLDLLEATRDKLPAGLFRAQHDAGHGQHKDSLGSVLTDATAASHATRQQQTQALVAALCGRSFDQAETHEVAQRIHQTTTAVTNEIDKLLDFLVLKGSLAPLPSPMEPPSQQQSALAGGTQMNSGLTPLPGL